MGKIYNNVEDIVEYEKVCLEDAKTVIVSFGSTARSVLHAVKTFKTGRF